MTNNSHLMKEMLAVLGGKLTGLSFCQMKPNPARHWWAFWRPREIPDIQLPATGDTAEAPTIKFRRPARFKIEHGGNQS